MVEQVDIKTKQFVPNKTKVPKLCERWCTLAPILCSANLSCHHAVYI